MMLFDQLAEQHIQEASKQGEFEQLPGHGRPLELDDDSQIPEELRAGYRLLKNAGFLPPELQLRKDIESAETLLLGITDGAERSRAQARLDWLRLQLDSYRQGRGQNLQLDGYQQRLLRQFDRATD